jgi:ABC-type nitrate/sulfonate/bicarbonate transport system permease component
VWNLASVAVLVGIWQLATGLQSGSPSERLIPSPSEVVFEALPSVATFGVGGLGGFETASYYGAFVVLARNALVTLARLVGGTATGIVIGVGLGLLMYWSPRLRRVIEPIILVIRNTPLLALMPLFLLWFGGKEIGTMLFIVFAMSLMIVVNTINAIDHLPPVYAKYAQTMGATRWDVTRTVVLPAILPELLSGVRVVVGMAWAITMGAEFLGAQSGLGRILIFSMNYLSMGRMIVILLIYMILAVILYKIIEVIGGRITRWSARPTM